MPRGAPGGHGESASVSDGAGGPQVGGAQGAAGARIPGAWARAAGKVPRLDGGQGGGGWEHADRSPGIFILSFSHTLALFLFSILFFLVVS